MNIKASFVSVVASLSNLTDEELKAVAEKPNLLKEFAAKLVGDITSNTFVVPLGDAEVPEQYREAAAKWASTRPLSGYTGPVAWKVKAGFTLKQHAPAAGPCYEKLGYLQGWTLQNDEPTKDSLVFWVPRLAAGSTNKTVAQMKAHRAELRQRYELPENHCQSFGSIALLFALILAHFKRTGERVPLMPCYAASDTLNADGCRLVAGSFDEGGLDCGVWFDGCARDDVGFFLLGVEDLGL